MPIAEPKQFATVAGVILPGSASLPLPLMRQSGELTRFDPVVMAWAIAYAGAYRRSPIDIPAASYKDAPFPFDLCDYGDRLVCTWLDPADLARAEAFKKAAADAWGLIARARVEHTTNPAPEQLDDEPAAVWLHMLEESGRTRF